MGRKKRNAVIPKSVNPARLKANLDSANIPLSKQDMEAINALDKGYRFLNGKFWEREGGIIPLTDFGIIK